MAPASEALDARPLELPPRIGWAVDEAGFAPTRSGMDLLRLTSSLSTLKKDRPREVSCTGVFLAAVHLMAPFEELASYAPMPSGQGWEPGQRERLGRLVKGIAADDEKWAGLRELALSYYGSQPPVGENSDPQGAYPSETLIDALKNGARGDGESSFPPPLTAALLVDLVLANENAALYRHRLPDDIGLSAEALRALLHAPAGPDERAPDETDKTTPGGTDETAATGSAFGFAREPEEELDTATTLGVDTYAAAVATVLRTARGEFCFGLLGPWGVGKTFLARRIARLVAHPAHYAGTMRRFGVEIAEGDDPDFHMTYDVVWHSAWKFRRTPEAWIFLYEAMVARSLDTTFFKRMSRTLRTGVWRNGYMPLVLGFLSIGLVAIPLSAGAHLIWGLAGLVGLGSLLYLAGVARRSRETVRSLTRKYATLTRHGEGLGMQALIGDDLRALVVGWIPSVGRLVRSRQGATAHPESSTGLRSVSAFAAKPWLLSLAALAAFAAAWLAVLLLPKPDFASSLGAAFHALCGILPAGWPGYIATGQATAGSSSGASWAPFLVLAAWCAACATALFLIRRDDGVPGRILLVIDDLDRCNPGEVIDLVESLKLLLEDDLVQRRVQVLMLIDEEVLEHAIGEKFKSLMDDRAARAQGATRESIRHQVVAEHLEKLFACSLRLLLLSRDEIAEIAHEYTRGDVERQKVARIAAIDREIKSIRVGPEPTRVPFRQGTTRKKTTFIRPGPLVPDGHIETVEVASKSEPGETQEAFDRRLAEHRARQKQVEQLRNERAKLAPAPQEMTEGPDGPRPRAGRTAQGSDLRFTEAEVELLKNELPSYMALPGRRPSPRAIRLFLFKYQLCRALLRLSGTPDGLRLVTSDAGSREILDALGRASFGDKAAAPRAHEGRGTLSCIVSQVA